MDAGVFSRPPLSRRNPLPRPILFNSSGICTRKSRGRFPNPCSPQVSWADKPSSVHPPCSGNFSRAPWSNTTPRIPALQPKRREGGPQSPHVAQPPWALESPSVNLPTSGMFSRYLFQNNSPQPRAATRNSRARFPEIPHDPLTSSAGACLCPSPSPRNHFPGPIPQNPRSARRAPNAAIHYLHGRPRKPNETESSWPRKGCLAQPLPSKIRTRAPFFVYHASYSCAAPRKSWGRSLPSSIFLPHVPFPQFSFLLAAPHLYIAAPKSWRGFPKPPLSPGFATAGVFPP